MATQEVTLRPGDSLSLLIDIPGQPMRLDLNLTLAGVAVAAALPAGAQTIYGGFPPAMIPAPVGDEPIDLDTQFDAEDSTAVPDVNDVQSLAAVEPYENTVPAPAPEAVEMEEIVEEEVVEEIAEYDLMFGDIDDSVEPEQTAAIDIPEDDLGLGGDIDILEDDLPLDDDLGPEEQPELQGKDKHLPNVDDTLPVWKKKASGYKDPELEIKKKGTGHAGGTGNFTVFLSPPRSEEKKETAAEIIAEVQGIEIGAAKTLAGKMIIKVINGVSEDEAEGVRDKFKEAGLSCRITKKR